MKNKQILILILFLATFFPALGQKAFRNSMNIPQESIFVHYNTTFLMPGENLYYRIYCLNSETGKLSSLSKVAYVELISTDQKTVFRNKVTLQNGTGNGYQFISSEIRSGNYKLIAYTRWMKNKQLYFAGDISIINPYQTEKNIIAGDNDSLPEETAPQRTRINDPAYQLQTDKEQYDTRKKVTVTVKNTNSVRGNFSLSVRRSEQLKTAPETHAVQIEQSVKNLQGEKIEKGDYLPELRGEILTGKILKSDNEPAPGQKVALSIPGKNFIYKISESDKEGKFYFSINQMYDGKQGVFQVIGKERDQYKIILDKPENTIYPGLNFYKLKVSEKDRENLVKHSVYNQIQNSYAALKPDSIKKAAVIEPFYGIPAKTYTLDDYTRFQTLHETVVEIIPEIYVRTRKGMQDLHVRVYKENIETGLTSLVLVDGIMVQDHKNLINSYNPKKIKSIDVINEMYLYGSQVFEGIISIKTFDENFTVLTNGDFIKKTDLFKPLGQMIMYRQTYDGSEKFKRIPDYRIQLLWEPVIKTEGNETSLTFYTSDVPGTYEIVLEGFTEQGKPVTLTGSFQVQ